MAQWDADGALGLAGGCTAMVVAGFVAAASFGPRELDGRAVVMALAAGVIAAVVSDRRASVAVTALTTLVFLGFLAGHAGDLTSGAAAWPYALTIPLAAVIGGGLRRPRRPANPPATQFRLGVPVCRLPDGPATRDRTAGTVAGS